MNGGFSGALSGYFDVLHSPHKALQEGISCRECHCMTQVRVAVLSGYRELLQQLGFNPGAVLLEAGFSASLFDDLQVDDLVSYQQIENLLQAAVDATGCEYFAVLLGSKQRINMLGIVGYVMQQSQDVRSALTELSHHFAIHASGGARIDLEYYGELAGVAYIPHPDQRVTQRTNELAMGEAMMVLRTLCGRHWKPRAVHFAHKAPANEKPFRQIYGAPVLFDRDKTEVLFSASFLEQPILEADPELNRILQRQIAALESDGRQHLVYQVEEMIRRGLPVGQCSIEHIAGHMAVHRRTLHRMLLKQGTSFSEILDDVRKKIAVERLNNSDMTITQIADYLGYADNSAFSRAFLRWYGVSPQRWRQAGGVDASA